MAMTKGARKNLLQVGGSLITINSVIGSCRVCQENQMFLSNNEWCTWRLQCLSLFCFDGIILNKTKRNIIHKKD